MTVQPSTVDNWCVAAKTIKNPSGLLRLVPRLIIFPSCAARHQIVNNWDLEPRASTKRASALMTGRLRLSGSNEPPYHLVVRIWNPVSLLVRGHRPEIMFGVLVVVLGRDPIARLDFGLGQCQITFIVFCALWAPLSAGRGAFDDHRRERPAGDPAGLCGRLFMFVIRPFCMAHSLVMAGKNAPCCARITKPELVMCIPLK
jgi:hypothetical protein